MQIPLLICTCVRNDGMQDSKGQQSVAALCTSIASTTANHGQNVVNIAANRGRCMALREAATTLDAHNQTYTHLDLHKRGGAQHRQHCKHDGKPWAEHCK